MHDASKGTATEVEASMTTVTNPNLNGPYARKPDIELKASISSNGMMYNSGPYPVPEQSSIATKGLIFSFGLSQKRRHRRTNRFREEPKQIISKAY